MGADFGMNKTLAPNQLIYKIFTAEQWKTAVADGRFEGAPVDIADGYVHMSASHQVRETAARHFAGQEGLQLAAFDPVQFGDALRWETSRGGDLFPHLYGILDTGSVISHHPLFLDDDGKHIFPDEVT